MSDPARSPTQLATPAGGGATTPAPVTAPDPYAGAILADRYRMLERLGEGGMGAVYRAEHIHMKKDVAIKLLHAELGRVDEAVRRFEREAQSASRLSHPNIIAVTDFGQAPSGEFYLAMEFVRGESLADLVARVGRLAIPRALGLLRQILSALEHAHAAGVVHRDLKPANVMISTGSDGVESAKILDFGIAKMSQGLGDAQAALTQGAMVFGTPSYMSPEQATAQEVDHRTDLYACGVILYELLTGRKPFVADDVVKVMAMQVTHAPPAFSVAAPGVSIPQALEATTMRALEKDRVQRFQSARDFSEALDAAHIAVPSLATVFSRATSTLKPIAKTIRVLHARLPWRIRRWTPLAGVVGVVLTLMIFPMLCGREARSPVASAPPAPKVLEPAMSVKLKVAEDAMARGKFTEARAVVMAQLSANPKAGRVHLLLGNIEFLEKRPRAGLDAYAEALRLDPGLRGDAALLMAVKGLLPDRALGKAALDLLINGVGAPATPTLVQVANEEKRAELRKAAREACKTLGCSDKLDMVSSLSLDLSQAKSCDEKREIVRRLGDSKDARAVDVLKRARGASRDPFGFMKVNDCVRKDIDQALKDLGGA